MADASSSIFNRKATEKLRSPDDLDKYVRVTNPGVWIVIVACIVLLAGLLAWGFFGTVSTDIATTGVSVDKTPMCFLNAEEASKVHEGDAAVVDGRRMTVESMSKVPLSPEETKDILKSDFLVSTLVKDNWTYVVHFKGDEVSGVGEGVPLSITITTERVAPISLILKNWS